MSGGLGIVGAQLDRLRAQFPGADAEPRPDGTTLVKVPALPLPPGWDRETVTVWFLAPVGYPSARPDCFFAEGSLRLSSGALPASANIQPVPGTNDPCVWFSWHVSAWNPVSDTLLTYVRVIADRLGRAQ